MIRRILVPLDGSQLAECVIPHAVALAGAFDAQLILFRVIGNVGGLDAPVDIVEWRLSQSEASAYLDALAAKLHATRVVTKLAEGRAAQQIVEAVHAEGAELVVLSSHGRGGLSDFALSGTAQKVVSSADASILVVRAASAPTDHLAEIRYRRILAPVDCSPRGSWALHLAAGIARAHGAELWAVHVVCRPELIRGTAGHPAGEKLAQALISTNRAKAEEYLREQVVHLSSADFTMKTCVLEASDPVEALANLINREHMDLAVVCAHGSSGSLRRPYGRLAGALISHGVGPVLVFQDNPQRAVEPKRASFPKKQPRTLTVR